MIALSMLPGLAYIFLGWLNDIYLRAVFWYLAITLLSIRGYYLYKQFDAEKMSNTQLESWYKNTSVLFYFYFAAWGVIFLMYAPETETGMHYIAIFTEIGASTVAAALLFPDKKLYKPIVAGLIIPMIIYFILMANWYGYVLAAFSAIFGWVLFYIAGGSYKLFQKTIFQSVHDYLTGIYNRQYFIEYLQRKMNDLRQKNEYSYLLLIDLDHFKTVNDSLGHDVGDALLCEVVVRLQNNIPENTMLSRLGGDEFIITGANYADKQQSKQAALKISEKLLSILKAAYIINQHHVYISASIGVSLISGSGASSADFIKEADIAMYEVKEKGRDGVFFFDEEMSQRVERNLLLEQLLYSAIGKEEIYLVYQPQLNVEQKVSGVEVLARWHNEEQGEIYPAEFINIAEQTGLIVEIGYYIIESAFRTIVDWNTKGINLRYMSINISMRQFMHHSFVADVTRLYQKYLANNDIKTHIVFEITESIVAEGDNITTIMDKIKDLGILFSMDDFGTGYSSLTYIRKLPIDEIKIDRHFIKDLSRYNNAEEMVNTILHIAEIFNLAIVAEGVETEQQQAFLLQHGCKVFQGYLYAKPLLKQDFETYYRDNS